MSTTESPISQPILAGIVACLVGYIGSFAIILTGLQTLGATTSQAASGLLVATVCMSVTCIYFALRYRIPLSIAWSTPAAALFLASGDLAGGWPAALGAFLVVAVLTLLAGLWNGFGRLLTQIPASIAQAMLAGVLLPLCLAPVTGIATNPWGVAPVIIVWLICMRLAPRWAVLAAFAAAAIAIAVQLGIAGTTVDAARLVPTLEWTTPTFTISSIVSLALPVFIVTMASQNVPGVAIMNSYGYDVPWRPTMTITSLVSAIGVPGGSPGVNLAAVSAALAASPEADPIHSRRWVTTLSAGLAYLPLAAAASALAVFVAIAPAAIIPAVAGIALVGSLASALAQAAAVPRERIAAAATFLVAASGMSFFGISAGFWALVVGLVVRTVLLWRRPAE